MVSGGPFACTEKTSIQMEFHLVQNEKENLKGNGILVFSVCIWSDDMIRS